MRKHCLLLILAGFALLPFAPARAADGGRVVYHYVGRVKLDFTTGKATVFGYFTHIDGIPAAVPLFQGTPSEATALFTFRADPDFRPLPGNGDLGGGNFALSPTLILPGDFTVYFDGNPAHKWDDPKTFTTGQTIAVFARELEQMAIFGTVAANTATGELRSSTEFPFDNRTYNFRKLARAVTNVTMGGLTPLPGSTQTAPIFAFAGYGLAAGN